MSELSETEALEAYATAINTLSLDPLYGLLAENFTYASQQVSQDLSTRREFLAYFGPKLETIKKSGQHLWAELAQMPDAIASPVMGCNGRPCLVLAQPTQDDLVATVFADVAGGLITGISLCIIPEPEHAIRSSEYPR